MKTSRLLSFIGVLSLVLGLILVYFFGTSIYSLVYDCEHKTGAVPVGGCEAFLQLPIYLWSGFPVLFSGISLAILGAGLMVLGRSLGRRGESWFLRRPATQRGLKSPVGATAPLGRIHYNFVKPHIGWTNGRPQKRQESGSGRAEVARPAHQGAHHPERERD